MASWPYSTRRWQRLRLLKLQAEPLCEECKARGQTVPAKHVDHVRAVRDGGDPFPPLEGLRSLCASCHSHKTSCVEVHRQGRARVRGALADGTPADPSHWWRSEGKSLTATGRGPAGGSETSKFRARKV